MPEPGARAVQPATLDQWLGHIELLYPHSIDMGLDRVVAVRDALGLRLRCPVITVGGTNGKGSACAMLQAVLCAAGYRTGCYTSPHLTRYNERVCVGGTMASDEALCRAFAAVEAGRAGRPLTYFEFGTLAAMWLFDRENVDVAVLEVGLGGRLDAVNAWDADCALVMSVALDHMDYLGDTREKIGWEKAHIYRGGRPGICADADPPQSLLDHAASIDTPLAVLGRDFGFAAGPNQWRYWGPGGDRHGLPHPALRGAFQLANASACVAALDALRDRLPVTMGDLRTGLLTAENPGRFQVLPGRPLVILDVAHNPHAARALAANLEAMPRRGRTCAVFGMLKDKDVAGVAAAVAGHVDHWYVTGLAGPRGASVAQLAAALASAGVAQDAMSSHPSVASAYASACEQAAGDDKILVFGSFHTVADVLAARAASERSPA